MTADLLTRRSARLMIVSAADRLLLFRYSDEHSHPFWATAGGELIGNEDYLDAAFRELQEETGIEAKIGPFLRQRVATYAVARSQPARWIEQYFLVPVEEEIIPNRERWTEEEKATITHCKWWSLSELMEKSVALKPEWLPQLLAEILENRR